jgi:hypothetical protein
VTRRARRALAACGFALAATACLPRARTNAECRWTDDVTALAPPGDRARRAHLLEDVRVAEDLGVRHADAVRGRRLTPAYVVTRQRCTEASLQAIARQHAVSAAEVTALVGAREPWIDALAVFLPIGILFAVASRVAVRRLAPRGAATVRLAIAAPCAAALAVAAAQTWGDVVETARLGNAHIGPRAAALPARTHGWTAWGAATALFAAVAALTPRGGAATASPRPRR